MMAEQPDTRAEDIAALIEENAALRKERDAFRAVLEGAGYREIEDIRTVETGRALGVDVAARTCALIDEAAALREQAKGLKAALERIMRCPHTGVADHIPSKSYKFCTKCNAEINACGWILEAALAHTGKVGVKPLDLSNLLKHAFLSGVVAAREIPPGDECDGPSLWVEYDPEPCAAYARIISALQTGGET